MLLERAKDRRRCPSGAGTRFLQSQVHKASSHTSSFPDCPKHLEVDGD